MGVISPNEQILTAILTRRGKEILSNNNERFIISKFCLGDDEINYALISDNDPDALAIESLGVFEPTSNEQNILKSKLIRTSQNIEVVAANNQYQQIPLDELQIETQLTGNTTFSLNDWNNDSCTITFAIYSPTNNNFFLGNSFIIDLSDFWIKYGFAFNFIPVFPSMVLGQSNRYWFNATDKYKDSNGNVMPVIIGIDNIHAPTNGTQLQNLVNDIGISVLSFRLQIKDTDLKPLFVQLLNNQTSFLTGNVVITNNDQTVVPVTNFYGVNGAYNSISTKVPINITF